MNLECQGIRKMKWLGLLVLSAILAAPSGKAADLPARRYLKSPPYRAPADDWSGFYIGGNGGFASSQNCWTFDGFPGVPFAPIAEGCHTATGGAVGGQIGYNFQSGRYVFGAETQGDWARMTAQNISPIIPVTSDVTRVDGVGLVTGRIGYAWNSALWFLKGGAAVIHSVHDYRFTGQSPLAKADDTRLGAAVGAGVEYGFSPNWSIGAEYDHVFVTSQNVVFGTTVVVPAGVNEAITQGLDMVTVKISYRWGPISAKN
jgi:outer membrane immunogenic protein